MDDVRGPVRTVDVQAEMRERAQLRRQARAEFEQRVIATVKKLGEAYSVQVTDALLLSRRKVGTMASLLRRLEKAGTLVSRFDESPISGNGRRYYRVRPVLTVAQALASAAGDGGDPPAT